MKKWIFLSLCLSLVFACDKIDDPVKENPTPPTTGGEAVRRILLEEFTGVRCNNCPEATEHAKALKSLYSGQVILVSFHAGDLAVPDGKHPDDFRTPEGNALFNDFNLFGVPVGFVDRRGFDQQRIIKTEGQWGPEIQLALEEEPAVEFQLSEKNFVGDTLLTIDVSVEALQDVSEQLMLSVYLLENGIVSPQTLSDKSVNEDYVHDHLFRTSFNSTYGQEIGNAGLTIGEEINTTHSIVIDQSWVKENCEVVAFVYQKSNFKVLQSKKMKL